MNVKEITSETGSLAYYFPVAIVVTWTTVRLAVAREGGTDDDIPFWETFFHWPFILLYKKWGNYVKLGRRSSRDEGSQHEMGI